MVHQISDKILTSTQNTFDKRWSRKKSIWNFFYGTHFPWKIEILWGHLKIHVCIKSKHYELQTKKNLASNKLNWKKRLQENFILHWTDGPYRKDKMIFCKEKKITSKDHHLIRQSFDLCENINRNAINVENCFVTNQIFITFWYFNFILNFKCQRKKRRWMRLQRTIKKREIIHSFKMQ